MNCTKIIKLTGKIIRAHLPQLLSIAAGGGVIATGIVSAVETKHEDRDMPAVVNYRKTIFVSVLTIGCIAGSAKLYRSRLHHTEKLLGSYRKAALAAGLAPTIGEKIALLSESPRPEIKKDDDKLLVYDLDNDFWFKATEADVLMGRIHINELAEEYGVASVHDFYESINRRYDSTDKVIDNEPFDSDILGWDIATDEWFENHDGHTSIRFSFLGGHKLDDGSEYWILQSYDPPMYSEYLGAPEEKILKNESSEDLWDRR